MQNEIRLYNFGHFCSPENKEEISIKSHLKEVKVASGGDGLMQAEWNDENGLNKDAEKSITKMLVEQQKQLDAMVALLKNDVSDLNILKGDLAGFFIFSSRSPIIYTL